MGILDFVWILVFAAAGLGAARYSLLRFGHWFTPVSVFIGLNCLSICIYHLRLLKLHDVTFVTHAIVLGALLAFLVGVHNAGEPKGEAAARVGGDAIVAQGLPQFFYITALLASGGWLLAAAILVGRHGLAPLLANPWILQLQFQMQFIGYLNLLGTLVPPAFVLLVRYRGFGWLPLLLTLSALMGLFLAGIKSYVFYSGLTTMFCWAVCWPHRFRVRHLALAMVALVAFFVAYNRVIDVFVNDLMIGNGPFARFTALHRPYLYIAGPWPAMDSLVHGNVEPPTQFASVVLDPLWKILGDGLGLIESVPLALPFTEIGTVLFNVYSFFGEVYRDLGIVGTIGLSWLLGLVSTRLYLRTRRRVHWGHVLVYGIVGHGLALSCFMYTYRFVMAFMLVYVYCVGFVALRGGVLVDRRGEP